MCENISLFLHSKRKKVKRLDSINEKKMIVFQKIFTYVLVDDSLFCKPDSHDVEYNLNNVSTDINIVNTLQFHWFLSILTETIQKPRAL